MVTLPGEAMPKKADRDLIQHTLLTWQCHLPAPLDEEDACEILTNTASLFRLLAEWEKRVKDSF